MAAATLVADYEAAIGDLKIHIGQYTVTANTNTVTFSDMTSIKFAVGYINGTEETPLGVTISNNILTFAGYSSGTETWDLFVVGI